MNTRAWVIGCSFAAVLYIAVALMATAFLNH